jgi:hypothetical protein
LLVSFDHFEKVNESKQATVIFKTGHWGSAPQSFCGRVRSVGGFVGLATGIVWMRLDLLSSLGYEGRMFVGHGGVLLKKTKPH